MIVANHVNVHGGGRVYVAPLDTVLSDIDVFQPDIVFVSEDDARVLTEANIRGTPTWVIEVLSNPYYERDKFRRYEAAKIDEHWLVNPYEDTLTVSLLIGDSRESEMHTPPAVVRPRSLPNLEIDLAQVLRP